MKLGRGILLVREVTRGIRASFLGLELWAWLCWTHPALQTLSWVCLIFSQIRATVCIHEMGQVHEVKKASSGNLGLPPSEV